MILRKFFFLISFLFSFNAIADLPFKGMSLETFVPRLTITEKAVGIVGRNPLAMVLGVLTLSIACTHQGGGHALEDFIANNPEKVVMGFLGAEISLLTLAAIIQRTPWRSLLFVSGIGIAFAANYFYKKDTAEEEFIPRKSNRK